VDARTAHAQLPRVWWKRETWTDALRVRITGRNADGKIRVAILDSRGVENMSIRFAPAHELSVNGPDGTAILNRLMADAPFVGKGKPDPGPPVLGGAPPPRDPSQSVFEL